MKSDVLLEKLLGSKISLESLEKLLWSTLLDTFQHYMVEILEELDEILKKTRDISRFRIKEKNPRTIQTLVGQITFSRRYYFDLEKQEYVYLLDEALGLETHKAIGPGLLKLAVTWATKGPSYRDARDRLTDLFGFQILSHEAIRQALLEVAAFYKREKENEIITKEGTKKTKILFIEVDGYYSRLQKNKKLKRKNQGKEIKMAVIHEGWLPRHNGKSSDYKLKNPIKLSNLKDGEELWEYIRGLIATEYANVDEMKIVINGDGAEWIRAGVGHFGHCIYQYDRFHVARELKKALRFDKQALKKAQKDLKKNDVASLAIAAAEALPNCENDKQKENLENFIELLIKNQDYIVDYRVRLKKKGHEISSDWRGLGAAESNVNKYKCRIGKRGRSWSVEGLDAMLTCLNSLFNGSLEHHVSRVLKNREENLLDKVTSGAGSVAIKATPSKFTGIKAGGFPATKRGTQGYSKLFNNLSAVKLI